MTAIGQFQISQLDKQTNLYCGTSLKDLPSILQKFQHLITRYQMNSSDDTALLQPTKLIKRINLNKDQNELSSASIQIDYHMEKILSL